MTTTAPTAPRVFPSRQRCAICAAPLNVHQEVRGGLCDSPSCRQRSLMNREAERRRLHHEAATRRARAGLVGAAKRLSIADPQAIPIAIVPANRRRLTALPKSRRQAFRVHLLEAIEEALHGRRRARSKRTSAAVEMAPPVMSAACATCRGHCCRLGGVHAFVDADTIRRYIDRTGVTSKAAIARAFLRHLPRASYQHACVYQARTGCNLPREMRADICNRFYCGPLREHWLTLTGLGQSHALLAAADEGTVVRLAVVDGRGALRPVGGVRADASEG